MFGLILEQTNECNNANKENLKSFYDLWGFGRQRKFGQQTLEEKQIFLTSLYDKNLVASNICD